MRCRRPLIPTFAIAAAAVAVLAAGCGGGNSLPAGSARPAAAATDFAGDAMAFAACVRSHGLSSYPDPQVSQSAGHDADQHLAGRTRSHLPSVQVGHARLRSSFARRGITVQCHQPTGAGSRTSATRPACARTESRTSPIPTTTGSSPCPSAVDQQAPQFQRATRACANVEPSSLSILNQPPGSS